MAAPAPFETLAAHAAFGGVQAFHRHDSAVIGLPMRWSTFTPPGAVRGTLLFLAGLTCTEETFAVKAGAQRVAAELGLRLVAPDTSPRDTGIAGEADAWDFGAGAGFWLDATRPPWSQRFRMESWLLHELLPLLQAHDGVDPARLSIAGHSMGGHGALTLGLRHPGRFAAVSAFAPICAPSRCPWGEKAFGGYFGDRDADPGARAAWAAHDACELLAAAARAGRVPWPDGLLVDQGLADKFLGTQLLPEALEAACAAAGQPLTLRRHAGYDHGYFFIASFVEDHLRWHAERLARAPA